MWAAAVKSETVPCASALISEELHGNNSTCFVEPHFWPSSTTCSYVIHTLPLHSIASALLARPSISCSWIVHKPHRLDEIVVYLLPARCVNVMFFRSPIVIHPQTALGKAHFCRIIIISAPPEVVCSSSATSRCRSLRHIMSTELATTRRVQDSSCLSHGLSNLMLPQIVIAIMIC
jgi:hypothetical protein